MALLVCFDNQRYVNRARTQHLMFVVDYGPCAVGDDH